MRQKPPSRFGMRAWRAGRGVARCLTLVLLGLLVCSSSGCKNNDTVDFPTRPEPTPAVWYYGIWGSAANDVWVVGQPGLLLHYDGDSWYQVPDLGIDQPLIGIWANAWDNIFVCGHKGIILHYNGTAWSRMDSGTDHDLFGVGLYRDGHVYCAGKDWTLRRLDGGTWVAAPSFIVRRNLQGTAIIDTLKSDEDPLNLSTVSYYGIGGDDGVILMADPPPPPPASQAVGDWQVKFIADQEWVTAAWSNPDVIAGNFVTTSNGRLYQLRLLDERLSWAEISSPRRGIAVYGIWTADYDGYYFVTQDGRVIKRTIGGVTQQVYPDPGNPAPPALYSLYAIWGTDDDNIWAVGIENTILHYQGGVWERVDTGLNLKSDVPQSAADRFGRPLP